MTGAAPRVLFIGTLPEPITGQSLACQVFLDELSRTHDVDVVNLSKPEFRNGVSSFARVFGVLRVVWDAARKAGDADAVYFTVAESFAGNLKDLLIYLACARKLSRMVIHLHGGAGLRHIMLGRRTLQRRANEYFVRRLGAAVVLGTRHEDVFAQALPADRIHVVPNFAQDDLFVRDESVERKFESTSPLRVLYLSNLLPGKGYDELLSAVESLPEVARARLAVDFAGGFESDAQQRAFLDRVARLPQVRYHGVVRGAAKRALFHGAHVFCLPTYYPYEGQPISILEAYASGCAVITTDHSGIRDVFAPGVNGFEVATRSVADLRLALEAAVADPSQLRKMALTSLNVARTRYRTATYNRDLIRILDAVIHHDLDTGAKRR